MKNLQRFGVQELGKKQLITTFGGKGFWATLGYYYAYAVGTEQQVMVRYIDALAKK